MHAGAVRPHRRARRHGRRAGARRRGLRAAAVLPLQRAVHGLVVGAERRRADLDPAAVLGVEHAARHPPLRRDDARVHRQGAELHPGHARAARRRRQPAAAGHRERGVDAATSASSRAGSAATCATATAPPRASSSSAATRRCREGALGKAEPTVKVVDPETGEECPPVRFGPDGRPTNLDEAVGEIVETAPTSGFEGYYNNEEATKRGSATAGTGPVTSRTGTPTAGCTSPGGRTSGCASTARTSPPRPSRRSSAATPTCARSRCTRCPTIPSATA